MRRRQAVFRFSSSISNLKLLNQMLSSFKQRLTPVLSPASEQNLDGIANTLKDEATMQIKWRSRVTSIKCKSVGSRVCFRPSEFLTFTRA